MEESTVQLVERFGLRFEEEGMPRIAGRMLGLLMVTGESRSLDDLAEDLQASKTSVSTNARLLERLGAVERTTRPGDRRDYYRIGENAHVRMLDTRLAQMRGTRDLFAQAVSCTDAAAEPAVRDRLCSFAQFYGDVVVLLEGAKKRWFEEQNGQPERDRDG